MAKKIEYATKMEEGEERVFRGEVYVAKKSTSGYCEGCDTLKVEQRCPLVWKVLGRCYGKTKEDAIIFIKKNNKTT